MCQAYNRVGGFSTEVSKPQLKVKDLHISKFKCIVTIVQKTAQSSMDIVIHVLCQEFNNGRRKGNVCGVRKHWSLLEMPDLMGLAILIGTLERLIRNAGRY